MAVAAAALLLASCRPVGNPAAPPAPEATSESLPAAVASVPTPAPDEPPSPPLGACPADRRQTTLDAVNLVRTDRGLAALRPEPRLEAAARAHALDLARHGLRGHEGSDGSLPAARATAAGYPWILVGENVARGYVTPSTVVSGWMASPPHRENLLNADYREVGVAWAEGPSEPNPVWVLVLGRRRAAPEGPPGCVGSFPQDPGGPGSAGGR